MWTDIIDNGCAANEGQQKGLREACHPPTRCPSPESRPGKWGRHHMFESLNWPHAPPSYMFCHFFTIQQIHYSCHTQQLLVNHCFYLQITKKNQCALCLHLPALWVIAWTRLFIFPNGFGLIFRQTAASVAVSREAAESKVSRIKRCLAITRLQPETWHQYQ